MIGRDQRQFEAGEGERLAGDADQGCGVSDDEIAFFGVLALPLRAAHGQALVVATCGSGADPVGQLHQLTMNPAGYLCVSTTTALGTLGEGQGAGPGCSEAKTPPEASKAAHAPPRAQEMRLLLAILLLLVAAPASAQQGQGMSKAMVVSSCGGGALPSGALTNLAMDTTGQLCVAGTAGLASVWSATDCRGRNWHDAADQRRVDGWRDRRMR